MEIRLLQMERSDLSSPHTFDVGFGLENEPSLSGGSCLQTVWGQRPQSRGGVNTTVGNQWFCLCMMVSPWAHGCRASKFRLPLLPPKDAQPKGSLKGTVTMPHMEILTMASGRSSKLEKLRGEGPVDSLFQLMSNLRVIGGSPPPHGDSFIFGVPGFGFRWHLLHNCPLL